MHPIDHTSIFPNTLWVLSSSMASRSSGGMYSGVIVSINIYHTILGIPLSKRKAEPKSIILQVGSVYSSLTRMFSGFKSQWANPYPFNSFIPSAICINNRFNFFLVASYW